MLEIAKRTGLGALMLMIIPIAVWVSGWQWHPAGETGWWRGLFWMTQTVTSPWGAITSIVLFGWFLWCLRFRWRPALALAGILLAALLLGQGLKAVIKHQVREPRPYVMWMAKTYNLDDQSFYALSGKARAKLIKKELENERLIPHWLRRHWQHETGFAFPSGHTVFAASWALLALGLLWPRRHYTSVALIMLWSVLVMSSRLVLGMHWPRDVAMGIVLGWLIITSACWLVQRCIGPLTPKPDEAQDIKSRMS